jgi:hypothetical protein
VVLSLIARFAPVLHEPQDDLLVQAAVLLRRLLFEPCIQQ